MRSPSLKHLALAALVLCSLLSSGLAAQEPELATEDEKMLYTLGLALAQQITGFGLTEAELELVQRGVRDGEISRQEAIERREQVKLRTFGRPQSIKFFDKLQAGLKGLIAESVSLMDRIPYLGWTNGIAHSIQFRYFSVKFFVEFII